MAYKRIIKHLPLTIAGLTMGLGVFINVNTSKHEEPVETEAIGNYSTNASTYYNSITATSGTQLAAQLHNLITSTHQYYASYADNGGNGYQKNTDQYYENGSKVSGYIYEFYSGVKWPNAWDPDAGSTTGGYNREHCWCQSNSVNTSGTQMWGESGGGADMHHLRPVENRLNSTRGNNKYGEISNRNSYKVYAKLGTQSTYALGGYNNGGVFEPLDSKKGDVARIILYVYLHYNSYTNTSLFGSYGTTNGSGSSSYFTSSLLSLTKTTNKSSESAALSMLLEWNNSDPVDEIEQRRNEQVAKYQGNRNPFIDNSEYANMIWGSGSSSTPTVNSVTVSPTTLNLDLNGTKTGTLTATVSVSNGAAQTVTWESSNTNVATVSSSGVVTAKAKGTCAVTATSTVNSNKSDSCTVKVVDTSGGGGTQNSGSQRVVSKSDSTYFETGSIYFSGNTTSGTASCDAFSVTQTKNSGNNIAYTYNEIRVYQYHTLTFTPNSGYSITSVAITANSNDYASALGGSNLNNCTKTVSNANVTLTPTNQSSAFSFTNSAQSRLNYLVVNYSSESSSTASTLQSISLNTSNVQTEFYVGGTFDYSGLVVTAHYADGTEDIVTPTSVSTPSMSSAGNKTITVSYTENNVTKTETYSISVVAKVITEIVASVNKVYHPGETISSSDITVEDNYGDEVSSFSFSNNNYQFTYADAASGGALTDKVFANAVAGANQVCSLTVQVQRVAHVSDSQFVWTKVVSTSSLTIGDEIIIADSTQNVALSTEQRTSNRAAVSIEKNNGQISWDTTESVVPQELELTSVSGITNAPSGSFGLYTGSGYLYAASSSANQLKTQNNNNINGAFVITIVDGVATISATGSSNRPLMRSNYSNNPSIFSCYAADATTGNPLEIYKKTEVSSETPVNLANYIMYEDTTNQCLTKLNTAVGYLGDLNPEDLSEFAESQDYVILTARTRLNAWALSQGKEIDYSNASMSNRSRVSLFNEQTNNSKTITLILIISILGVSSVGMCLYIHKKREN